MSANFILSELLRELNNADKTAKDSPVSAENLAELIKTLDAGKINNNQAKEVLTEMFASGKTADAVIAEKGFEQISDVGAIEKNCRGKSSKKIRFKSRLIAAATKSCSVFSSGKQCRLRAARRIQKVVNEILRGKLAR